MIETYEKDNMTERLIAFKSKDKKFTVYSNSYRVVGDLIQEVFRAKARRSGEKPTDNFWLPSEAESLYEAIRLVVVDDINNEIMHERWVSEKKRLGWKYGEEKDAEKKTHPCIRPFSDLSHSDQKKDDMFIDLVRTLSRYFDLKIYH